MFCHEPFQYFSLKSLRSVLLICAATVSAEFRASLSSLSNSLCQPGLLSSDGLLGRPRRGVILGSQTQKWSLTVLAWWIMKEGVCFYLFIYFSAAALGSAFGGGLVSPAPRAVVWGRRPRPELKCGLDGAGPTFSHREVGEEFGGGGGDCVRWRVEF